MEESKDRFTSEVEEVLARALKSSPVLSLGPTLCKLGQGPAGDPEHLHILQARSSKTEVLVRRDTTERTALQFTVAMGDNRVVHSFTLTPDQWGKLRAYIMEA